MDGKFTKTIILIGCKGSGKSTHGKALAEHFKLDFFDVDDVIKEITGKDARSLYADRGVGAFMMAEETACHKIISTNREKNIIIATGGGICDNPPALNELRETGRFVFLNIGLKESVDRVKSKITKDPFGNFQNVPAYVAELHPKTMKDIERILTQRFEERIQHYKAIADVTAELKQTTKEENLKLILEALNKREQ